MKLTTSLKSILFSFGVFEQETIVNTIITQPLIILKIIKYSPSHQIENFQISVKPVFEELSEGNYICMRKFWILEENSISNGHCDVKRVNFS